MLLRKVLLENYGLYQNKHEFNLVPERDKKTDEIKPIILFGGKNGAGKTTFLDAVRLTLYGKQSLGANISNKEYHTFLKEKIHNAKDKKNQKFWARVAIDFDYSINGQKEHYYIERLWKNTDGSIDEKVLILRNNHELDEVESNNWEAFAASIVPERLSQLFFFDGEKIKTMAEDDINNTAFREAVCSLLGLDIVDKLDSDLKIYLSREAKKNTSAANQQLIREYEDKIEEIKKSIKQNEFQNIEYNDLLKEKEILLQEAENKLHIAGGKYAEKREKEKEKENNTQIKIEIITKNLKQACEGPLPFALCPNIYKDLLNQLNDEQTKKENELLKSSINNFSSKLKKNLQTAFKNEFLDVQLLEKIIDNSLVKETSSGKKISSIKTIHDLSSASVFKIKEWIKTAKKQTTQIKNETKEFEKLINLQRNTLTAISRAPEEDTLKPLFTKITNISNKIGSINQQIKTNDEQIKQLNIKINNLLKEKNKLEEDGMEHVSLTDRVKLTNKIQKALHIYQEKLMKIKIDELEIEVSKCFNELNRKKDYDFKFKINPETFEVDIYTSIGKTFSKMTLSAGEKQIYAISLLWGLAKTSGRALPVIIDTPLGRLDKDHRKNIAEKYFPYAGHQVIILSTDTEIDERLQKIIKPHITRSYHLSFNQKKEFTETKEEYFWS